MKCRSCNAEIVWVKTANGKSMPIDAQPYEDGNLALVDGMALVATEPKGSPLYKSHFATCPNAKQHRKASK